MKLISINKLKAIIGQWYERKHLETFKFPKSISLTDLAELIESTPTIDAIPIAWIEKRLQRAVAFTHSKAEGNIIDDGCVVTVVSASFTANVLLNLLEDWEKENETN